MNADKIYEVITLKQLQLQNLKKPIFISGVLHKDVLDDIYKLIELKSRSWRGRFQKFTKDFVKAYKIINK